MQEEHEKKPISQKAFKGSTHCTTGCTLGNVVGEWLIFFGSLSIFGLYLLLISLILFLHIRWVLDFSTLVLFPCAKWWKENNYLKKEGVKEDVKADTLSSIT